MPGRVWCLQMLTVLPLWQAHGDTLCESVAHSCPTLCDRTDCSLPGSSVHGTFQARMLQWAAISLSRGSSRPRDQTRVSCTAGRSFIIWTTREDPVKDKSFIQWWHCWWLWRFWHSHKSVNTLLKDSPKVLSNIHTKLELGEKCSFTNPILSTRPPLSLSVRLLGNHQQNLPTLARHDDNHLPELSHTGDYYKEWGAATENYVGE